MKNKFPSLQPVILLVCLHFVLLAGPGTGYAVNPDRSPTLINLSASVNPEPMDDIYPEMVIEGNTIHVTWLEYKYGTETWLYYRRSADLGKTWEAPKQIIKLKNSDYMRYPQSRELAVDGNNVHIAVCDYDYPKNGTGSIFYVRSVNGGASFEPAKELTTTGGGYNPIRHSYVKAEGGKVAIAFAGIGPKNGIRLLFSSDGGGSFTEKLVTTEGTDLSDLWFDGSRIVIVSGIAYYYYGLNWGRVYASVSSDMGATFKTNKISFSYKDANQNDVEKCLCMFDVHYAPKIAVSGGVINVIYEGVNEKGANAIFCVRSADGGQTFEKPADINDGLVPNIQAGQQTILGIGDHVYTVFMNTGSKVFFSGSSDKGKTFSPARSILPDGFYHIEKTWWPSLVADPKDASGKSFYFAGYNMYSVKSTDGGESFSGSTIANLLLNGHTSNIMADMAIDNDGVIHWIAEARYRGGTDKDIYYRKLARQPDPGTVNKSYYIETTWNEKAEALVVPSSQHLNFDSAMTAEAWVKFDAASPDQVNILAKINGYDGDDYYLPPGYNMGFRRNQGKSCINSAIATDKGDFINWGDCTIEDTLWHHIAFTYDAKAGLNNFRTYVDGTLRVQTTVTGKIRQGDGLLLIGSRTAFYKNTKYQVDDIRLWNRALSQEELLANQTRQLTGKEDGLTLFLNFNDTFKDISGNGNDAIPVYLGTLVKSDFDPPVPDFDIYKSLNQVTLNNKTIKGGTYQWDFGDTKTSAVANPAYTYTKPGEYQITMLARNSNSKTAAIKKVTIEGLNKIEPTSAGNLGLATIQIFGGGLTSKTGVKLRKQGEPDITGKDIYMPDKGILSATFDLYEVKTGDWDVVVINNNVETKLEKAFKITQGQIPQPWVTVTGRSTVLINTWFTSFVNFGNKGTNDIRNVPVFIAVSDIPGLETEFIDFGLDLADAMKGKGLDAVKDSVPIYFVFRDFFGQGKDARIFPIVIQSIPQNYSGTMSIRIKSPQSYEIWAWTYEIMPGRGSGAAQEGQMIKSALADYGTHIGFFDWDVWTGSCMRDVLIGGLWDLGGMIQGLLSEGSGFGCVKASIDALVSSGWTIYEGKPNYRNALWDVASVAANCAGSQLPLVKGAKLAAEGIAGLMTVYGNMKRMYDCINDLSQPIYAKKPTQTVGSFDPNEMVGPGGYGPENYIRTNSVLPYTIFFENKSTATAPAHVVSVKDTLDLTSFNLEDFSFESFGWGDTIINLKGNNIKEFSADIDIRPSIPLIVRVFGKLDTISGVAGWEFLSLNPQTMALEEDPFIGFLPPNNSDHAGEGFVSFRIGLNPALKTNDKLKNKATIIFDANEPIVTNEYINTLDLDKPQSKVFPLEATTKDYFTVSWPGTDKGSGIHSYTVFVLQNDTLLSAWKINTTETSAVFVGEVGSSYKFYSVAVDNVSLLEDNSGSYDAFTTVTVDLEEFELKKAALQVYPSPARESVTVLLPNAPCGAYVVEIRSITGNTCYSALHDDYTLSSGLTVDTSHLQQGSYLVRIIYGNKSETKKITIRR